MPHRPAVQCDCSVITGRPAVSLKARYGFVTCPSRRRAVVSGPGAAIGRHTEGAPAGGVVSVGARAGRLRHSFGVLLRDLFADG
jgi:hypothetical protein